MKKLVVVLITIPILIYSQNLDHVVEYYNNGTLKYNKTTTTEGEIIKEYYKNGQLKYHQNDGQRQIEKYYKNGQLSYRKTEQKNTKKEVFYDRSGSLMIEVINDVITFNSYEHGPGEKMKANHRHNHHHGHNHEHDHHH